MKALPEEFIEQTRAIMGDELFERYLRSFDEPSPVSIRLNPLKALPSFTVGYGSAATEVPWCRHAYYLPERPSFTFDPLFHAGLYYVQEAASMFLDLVLQQHLPDRPVTALDLCAAPGGKSTLLRSALPEGSHLTSNEPIRNRASILAENVTKWGYPNHTVTNLYPRDFKKSKQRFDVILCDVPCSGEGMFRKDAATIDEWSPQNVEKCWRLQREIVSDAWTCLSDGGLLIYSTCTFNTKENEQNVRWMMEELGAEVLPVAISQEWHIVGSLLEGFHQPVYRFIPGMTRGEGLFMCVLKKPGTAAARPFHATTAAHSPSVKTKKDIPSPAEALSVGGPQTSYPSAALTYPQAMSYLRREAIVLPPDTPRGLVVITFEGAPLGFAKNIGNRANNLYPKEWCIRTTHIPHDYEAILKHT